MTRWWLRLTTLLGFVGVGFHAYGVSRNMGGWRNWRQTVLKVPRCPRPPASPDWLGRPGGTWPVGGSSRCLIASLAMTF